jgi:hypothetical protein
VSGPSTGSPTASARVDRLYSLDAYALTEHAELVHGALTGPVSDFVAGRLDAERNLSLLRRPVLLFAHTHQAALWEPATLPGALRRRIRLGVEYEVALSDDPADRRLKNPGAVCDPDGARWLELRVADGAASVAAVWHRTSIRRSRRADQLRSARRQAIVPPVRGPAH